MITIALDEKGKFENCKNNEPVYIGGVVYDGDDVDKEAERIRAYLEKICKTCKAKYPVDMHYKNYNNKAVNFQSNDRSKEAEIKKKFSSTASEFFKSGKYNGKNLTDEQRCGKYYIYAYFKSKEGKTSLIDENISELVRENFAANLYIHMSESTINRLVFYNPVIENINRVKFSIAERNIPVFDEGMENQFETLGNKKNNGRYNTANNFNYITALEREMLNNGKYNIFIDEFDVKSIKYEATSMNMEFLYLSDLICSHLSFNGKNTRGVHYDAVKTLNLVYEKSKELVGEERSLIWGYDEIDNFYDKAWKAYEKEDYYTALSEIYDGLKSQSAFKEFYEKIWFKDLKEKIKKRINNRTFSEGVMKLKKYSYSSNLDNDKFKELYESFEELAGLEEKYFGKQELYDLYDMGISAFNHKGNYEKSRECVNILENTYVAYVPMETYLATRNKISVAYCDMLEFENALEMTNKTVEYYNDLFGIRKKIFGDEENTNINYNKTLSIRGQIKAYMLDSTAEDDFKKCLDFWNTNYEYRDNYKISMSYLLHYYIATKNKKKYEENVVKYFANRANLIEQYKYIMNEENERDDSEITLSFALFVYIKALYTFYFDNIPAGVIEKLSCISKNVGRINNQLEHPWEMINKYIYIILKKYGNDDEATQYKKGLEKIKDNAVGIIKDIAENSIQICECKVKNEEVAKKYTYMYN